MRSELFIHIAAAQFALERSLAALTGNDAASRAVGNAGLADLAAIHQSVATADPASLIAMRADVAGTIAAAAARASQIQTAAAASSGAEAARDVAEARNASRNAVAAAMDGMHDFDNQLEFASAADADAYRQREAERRAYVAGQQAKGTAEGDLNASAGALGQMADAKAHGAGGPEFDKRWNKLVATTKRLREQVERSGGSTTAFDDRLHEDLRAILKSKGLSDTEIAARFAANPDPLEAVKAFADGRDDIGKLNRSAERSASAALTVSPDRVPDASDVRSPTNTPVITMEADAIAAKLRATGVVAAEHRPDDGFTHGVTQSLPAASAARVPG